MKKMVELSPSEKKVLLALKAGKYFPTHIAEETGLEQVAVMSALSWLEIKKLVEIEEKAEVYHTITDEGTRYIEEGLPERRVAEYMQQYGFKITLADLQKKFDKDVLAIAIKWIKGYGYGKIDKGMLIIENPSDLFNQSKERERFLAEIKEKGKVWVADYAQSKEADYLKEFLDRQLIFWNAHMGRRASLTPLGEKIIESGIELEDKIAQLSSEHIQTGKWKEKEFRKYDIHTFAPSIAYGKCHPLTKLANKIRDIFIGMGFKEIEYDFIQPCFWNMDALFVPQDHPARDVQDSFYIPGKLKIPAEIAKKIKAVHKKAWKYKWSLEESEKLILRTHTTVNTIRYLSENNISPVKVFSIGRNFRREAIDATHLPEFTQIEGIVMEKGANLSMLLGVLKGFYKKIGFEDISFRPSYFPFTEPSIEVLIDYEGKKLEMGGAGIFRPEVTKPFGIKDNVLAWGLGLERLAMLKLGLKDIRALYMSDLEWLRSVSVHVE